MERLSTVETDTALTRREATLRSAATTSLAGIALVQAIELPSLFAQGKQLAVLSLAGMAVCVALGLSLAAGPAGAARQVWRVVAAAGGLVLAGWAVPHAFALPGIAGDTGHWDSVPGLVCAVLAAACLALAVAAVRPRRATMRAVAGALAIALALVPATGVVLVALGPGTTGGETVLASGGHQHSLHSHGSPENSIVFQPLPGGKGGQYVFRTQAPPHQTAVGIGMMVAAAFVFTYGAIGYLRRRAVSVERLGLGRVEGGLA
jgi:hypothetical protein